MLLNKLPMATLADLLHTIPLRVHLLGVAGSGMSGLAGLLLAIGHRVSGSDRTTTSETERLQRGGLEFHLDQRPEHVHGADAIIYSSAIRSDNPSFVEAQRLGIPLYRRADALAAILSAKKGILVCGTHGKTTTSAMIAHLLREANLNPSHYIGAEIPILGTNAHWNTDGTHMVAEGDESDGTLANYRPWTAVVLNIEADHLDYYKDLAAIEEVFATLVCNTSGALIYCADDPVARRVCESHPGASSFGSSPDAIYRFDNVTLGLHGSEFDLFQKEHLLGRINLGVPGRHNASNATAAAAAALMAGVDFQTIRRAFAHFQGAKRRIELRHESANYRVFDDYGHHPTEIRATLKTVRHSTKARLAVIFQPHRYSRTVALRDDFATAFNEADSVFICDIYPAGETPLSGVNGFWLAEALTTLGHPAARGCTTPREARLLAGRSLQHGDTILTLGAGNIHQEANALVRDLVRLERFHEEVPDCNLRLYEPLSTRTTLKVGGPAQFFAEPHTETALAALLRVAAELGLPHFLIGRGSNLLVRDGGIPGLVISLSRGEFTLIEISGHEIRAGAGVRFKQLAGAARAVSLGGFEWMDGIPGTVGGSLRMNAGAMGVETFDQIVSVRVMDSDGRIYERTPSELGVGYRHATGLDKEIALCAVFRGTPASKTEIDAKTEQSVYKRKTTQPVAASAGCIFRNPDACPAGKLVDELGLKGTAVGAARVSEVHGNFIVNEGGATASDILSLIHLIQERVASERGILLEPEVRIVGFDDPAF